MQTTITRTAELAARPSACTPPGLGGEVEAGLGGDLDSSPSPRPPATASQRPLSSGSLSVADLQQALRLARSPRDGERPGLLELPSNVTATYWLSVVAAHSGAGASTVALAVAEAAARERAFEVHLVEYFSDPSRSGLAAAAVTELGVDPTGAWRHGQRGGAILHRRATSLHARRSAPLPAPEHLWPTVLSEPPASLARLVVVDLSGAPDGSLPRGAAVLVVFRVSVPGVRAAEMLLERLGGDDPPRPVVAAGIGPRHWPAAVNASVGTRLSWLRECDRVIDVPSDRRIAVTGVTADPLPKPALTAASRLLSLLALDGASDLDVAVDGDDDVAALFGFATQAQAQS